MPIQSTRAAKLLTAGKLALAVAAVPAVGLLSGPAVAQADNGLPEPQPVLQPEPVPDASVTSGGCQPGESLAPSNGNCVPTMTQTPASGEGESVAPTPMTGTGETTSTIQSGIGADLVPNINGDSCSGYWESTVCFAEQGPAAVQPRTTISSSP